LGQAVKSLAGIENEMAEEVAVRKEREREKEREQKGSRSPEFLEEVKTAVPRLRQYFSDVMVETRKVTRPGKQEVYGTTVMVVLTTFLFGIYFAVCDRVFQYALTSMLSYFRHHS
jgi:preprotein translocase SecE subunit